MKIIDIVRTAAVYLQENGVLSLPEMGGNTFDAAAQKTLNLLIRCANLALKETASEYIPLIANEKLTSDGQIKYSALKKQTLAVLGVKDEDGGSIKFKAYPAYIAFEGTGEFTVEYSYVPPDAGLNDETEYGARLSPHTLAYGAASEYCLISGLYEEANIWDSRFRAGLTTAAGARNEMRLPRRRWL